MKEVFEKIAVKVDEYGADGDMKKTQFVLDLIGSVTDPNTYKCILVAGEQGMEMNCYSLENLSSDQIAKMGNNTLYLRESDFIISGVDGILAFINARGLGYSLDPKNAQLASMQNYWVDIANNDLSPSINKLIEGDKSVLKDIELYLDTLNDQLKNNKYVICDKYSFADVYWVSYMHCLLMCGYENLINDRKNVKDWIETIKSRKSQCGQDIVAYDNLPSKEDIANKKLSSISITDF